MTTLPVKVSLVVSLAIAAGLAAAARPPIAVSPGGEQQALRGEPCPTFSWAPSQGGGFEIVVYAVAADGRLEAQPAVRERLPAGATSWTLAQERCLAPGRYAWSVRHLGGEATEAVWARPRLLLVESTPPPELERQMERAVERVLEQRLADGKLTPDRAGRPAFREAAPAGPTDGPRSVAGAVLFDPEDCTEDPPIFGDVPNADPRCEFVKQLYFDAISEGCAPGLFCPDNAVTRGQLAVYLERAMRGTAKWDALGDSVVDTEIVDTLRTVNIPVTTLLNCSDLTAFDFAAGPSKPYFEWFGEGIALVWDLDDGDYGCTSFVVPADYVSDGKLRLVSRRGAGHDNDWNLSLRLGLDGQSVFSVGVSALNCDAGGTAGVVYTCDMAFPALQPGESVGLEIQRGGGSDVVKLMALHFEYLAKQ